MDHVGLLLAGDEVARLVLGQEVIHPGQNLVELIGGVELFQLLGQGRAISSSIRAKKRSTLPLFFGPLEYGLHCLAFVEPFGDLDVVGWLTVK